MENELRKSKDGPLFLGLMPKISVDPRILCPCEFTREFQPPPPPTIRFYEIAAIAGARAATAMWNYRQYIEVIKIGFTLGISSPDELYITAEAVMVIPISGEKVTIKADQWIDSTRQVQGMGLLASEVEYERVCDNLAGLLTQKSKWVVQDRATDLSRSVDRIQRFQQAFGIAI